MQLIVERALKYPTRGIIFAHNHRLLDHVILSDKEYFSFYEYGLIEY